MKDLKFKFWFSVLIILFLFSTNSARSQIETNQIILLDWQNNSLTINTTQKISYTETRLKSPDRLIIDLLNCSMKKNDLSKGFKSNLDESISILQPSHNQVRIVFIGSASINRKAYLTNNERTLIIKIARIDDSYEDEKISENEKQTALEKYTPGNLKEISVEEDNGQTDITISATRSIKYNTYSLKNPDRFAIDLLNILPPDSTLPTYMSTPLVTGIRVGRAANGLDATRIVIDLAKENLDCDVDSTILGNKLKIKIKVNKEKEEATKRSGIRVVIDPGHGGYDTGASYGGYEEKIVNLIISEKLKKLLEESGITVFLTRDDDGFLSLAERVEITNSIKPNVFISVHANALATSRTIRGVETYYWTPQSQKLAFYVHKSILSKIKLPDHFIRKARFYVIRYTSSPAVLAELGFMSNYDDRQLLTNKTTQDEYAKALSEAILRFLDIEKEPIRGQKSEK